MIPPWKHPNNVKGKPSRVETSFFSSFSIFLFSSKIVILEFNQRAIWSYKNMKSSKELSHSPTLWGHFLPSPTLKGNFPKEKIATSIGWAKTKKKKREKNCDIHLAKPKVSFVKQISQAMTVWKGRAIF